MRKVHGILGGPRRRRADRQRGDHRPADGVAPGEVRELGEGLPFVGGGGVDAGEEGVQVGVRVQRLPKGNLSGDGLQFAEELAGERGI